MENQNIVQNTASVKKSGKKKFIVILVILLILGGVASFFLPEGLNVWSKLGVSGDKNLAAVINGEKITKSDLDIRTNQAKEFLQAQGSPVDEKAISEIKNQMLLSMVNEKIILQNAKKELISVSDEEISTVYKDLIAKYDSKESFEKELSSKNLTEKEVKNNIADQMVLNKYIEKKIDRNNITVTDSEINTLYKNYSDKQENMPKLEEIKSQLAEQVKQEKYKVAVLELIEKLKKDGNVKIFP